MDFSRDKTSKTLDFGSFKWLTGDMGFTQYGGKWYRKIGAGRYHVIELMNWIETVGEHEAKEIGAEYNVDLSEVDLAKLATPVDLDAYECDLREAKWRGVTLAEWTGKKRPDETTVDRALSSYCWEYRKGEGIVAPHSGDTVAKPGSAELELVLLEACHGHGNRAPLWDESGNSYLALMRAARAYSLELSRDAEAHADALARPVNMIGTSAEDYMLGRILAADTRR